VTTVELIPIFQFDPQEGNYARRPPLQEEEVGQWYRIIDTSRKSSDDFRKPGQEVPLNSRAYVVGSRSVVVLVR
jgi:hypothetical protein